jgi:hypothetical protein
MYARPFVNDNPADLILEIGGGSTMLNHVSHSADFVSPAKSRMASLLQAVGKKMNLSDPQLEKFPVKFRLERGSDLNIDGERNSYCSTNVRVDTEIDVDDARPAKRRRSDASDSGPCVVRTGQWRLQVQTDGSGTCEVILIAVKLDICTTQRVHNRVRNFL